MLTFWRDGCWNGSWRLSARPSTRWSNRCTGWTLNSELRSCLIPSVGLSLKLDGEPCRRRRVNPVIRTDIHRFGGLPETAALQDHPPDHACQPGIEPSRTRHGPSFLSP